MITEETSRLGVGWSVWLGDSGTPVRNSERNKTGYESESSEEEHIGCVHVQWQGAPNGNAERE